MTDVRHEYGSHALPPLEANDFHPALIGAEGAGYPQQNATKKLHSTRISDNDPLPYQDRMIFSPLDRQASAHTSLSGFCRQPDPSILSTQVCNAYLAIASCYWSWWRSLPAASVSPAGRPYLKARKFLHSAAQWVNVPRDVVEDLIVHSEHWGKIAESKLKSLGVSFPWKSQESKSFTGLGVNATTAGCRVLPFALKLENTEVISGILESHQVKQGKTPLLLSLYSQLALGLIKDLANQRVYFKHATDGTSLPIYKCATTGLLLVNMTAGITV